VQYSNIHGVSYMLKQEQNLAACNAFCIYFKVFKYTGMIPGECNDCLQQTARHARRAL
jgi:hypothetical protein